MQVPVSMLKGSGGTKAAAVLAVLVGLAIVTAMKQRPSSPPSNASPR